jgi:hypothetical protein
MIRLFITLLIAAACFGAGYFLGARNTGSIEKDLTAARSLVVTQKSDLMVKLESTLIKLRIASLKELISDAKADVMDKNYGTAQQRLEEAKKSLDSLLGDMKWEQRKDLTPVVVNLDDARAAVDKNDPEAKTKLDTLKTQLTDIENKIT